LTVDSSEPRDRGAVGVALGIVALGAFFGIESFAIPVSPLYAKIGPTVFPRVVAAGLVVLGLVLLREAWRGAWRAEAEADGRAARIDWRAVLTLSAGLLATALLMNPAGFVIAATLLFVLTARAFGSAKLLRDGAIGFALALLSFVGFVKGLGLDLPAGLLEGLI
jgi:putative tricarboxylic transport membrane protein